MLKQILQKYPRLAVAYSGGVDSVFLTAAALACGCQVKAYTIWSELIPESEKQQALKTAQEIGVDLKIIRLGLLKKPQIAENSAQRCYFCKKIILQTIQAHLTEEEVLAEGTNASDSILERPGSQALQELGVVSPLREAGLTKVQIRQLAKEKGLSVWDSPSYACLATRIPVGQSLELELLKQIEQGENFLRQQGLKNFRLKLGEKKAYLQVAEAELPLVRQKQEQIEAFLRPEWGNLEYKIRFFE